jgi:hypothetical protein
MPVYPGARTATGVPAASPAKPAPPPCAITATRKFPRIPASPIPTTTSRPSGRRNPQPGVRFRPAHRYNHPEPIIRPTRSVRPPPAPPRSVLVASIRTGLKGTLCVAQGEAVSPRHGAALGQSASRSETMENEPDLASATSRSEPAKPSPLPHNPTATGPPACRIHSPEPTGPNEFPPHPPARSARPREPTSPHRIHRQCQHESLTASNPKFPSVPRAVIKASHQTSKYHKPTPVQSLSAASAHPHQPISKFPSLQSHECARAS